VDFEWYKYSLRILRSQLDDEYKLMKAAKEQFFEQEARFLECKRVYDERLSEFGQVESLPWWFSIGNLEY